MVKPKHIPVRTCVACRATEEKRDLLRIVRQPDGVIRHDPKGKMSGRGAYLCARAACIALAKKQKKLERSLKVNVVPEELFQELISCLATLQVSPLHEASKAEGTIAVSIEDPGMDTAASGPQESEEI
jgi:predicted RNA-binding protein YlxR (DUF448 family)